MARPKLPARLQTAPRFPSNSLVASATRFPGRAPRIHRQYDSWQAECYRHYSICGEARFAARFFGHAMSKALLTVSTKTPEGMEVVTNGPVYDLLADLFNGKDGQAQMLEAIGIHLTIAGECYLVGRTEKREDEVGLAVEDEIWEVLSPLEIKVSGEQWTIAYGGDFEDIHLTKEDVVIRIWNPNPAKRIEADSPFRSLLPILTEIEWLTRSIFAQVSSRLVGAGILFLPQGMTFPPALDSNGNAVESSNEAEAFMLALGGAMMAALEDPGSPASKIPITVTAPADLIDKVKLQTFWSELDENSKDLRSEAIRRFAIGMDLPAEQILGMSSNEGTGGGTSNGVSHWGAWQIEEATIKMHIEPMLETITNALTIGYTRPLEPTSLDVVTYDTSALRLRPDRSEEAFQLYDRGVIGVNALLRENGFDPSDIPDEKELATFFLRKIASGSATPEQVARAMDELFKIDIGGAIEGEIVGETRETRPPPSLESLPDRPRTPEESTPDPPSHAALVAASEGLVFRALEKAGNRILNSGKRGKDKTECEGPVYEAYLSSGINGHSDELLRDAFVYAPQALEHIAEPDKVVPVLQSYCEGLMATQLPHSRARLAEHLTAAGLCR